MNKTNLYNLNKDELILLISTIQEETENRMKREFKEKQDNLIRDLFRGNYPELKECEECNNFVIINSVINSSKVLYELRRNSSVEFCHVCGVSLCNFCDKIEYGLCLECKNNK